MILPAILSAALVSGAAATCETTDELDLQLQWVLQPQFAGFLAAERMGYYAEECLYVLTHPVDGLSEEKVADGEAQFGISWVSKIAANKFGGSTPNITVVAQHYQRGGFTQISWADDELSDPASWNNTVVGYWPYDNHYNLIAALSKRGLSHCFESPNAMGYTPACEDPMAHDVMFREQWFEVESFIARDGSYDTVSVMSYNELAQVYEHIDDDSGELLSPTLFDAFDFVGDETQMLEDAIIVENSYLEQNRDLVVRFLKGTMRGWAHCRDAPEECTNLFATRGYHATWQMADVNKLVWPAELGWGRVSDATAQRTLDIAFEAGFVPVNATVDMLFDWGPLEEAAAAVAAEYPDEDMTGEDWEAEDLSFCLSDSGQVENCVIGPCEEDDWYAIVGDCVEADDVRPISYAWVEPKLCEGGEALPGDLDSLQCDYVTAASGAGAAVVALSGLGAALMAFFASWLFVFRATRIVKRAQLLFCLLFVLGAALLCLSNIAFLGDNTDTNCVARPWLFHMSATLMLGGLLLKIFRVWKLFSNKSLKKLVIRNSDILKGLLALLLVDALILGAWTAATPPERTESVEAMADVGDVLHYTCQSEQTNLKTIAAMYKVVQVLAGCYLAFQTRNVDSSFSEAKHIMFALYNVALFGAVSLLITEVADVEASTGVLIQAVLVVLSACGAVALVIVPKMIAVHKGVGVAITTTNTVNTYRTSAGAAGKTSMNMNTDAGDARISDLMQQIQELRIENAALLRRLKNGPGAGFEDVSQGTASPSSFSRNFEAVPGAVEMEDL